MAPSSARDVVIVGGGHNGLVAAAMLARAGFKPLVLERSPWIGGCAITTELAPGFRCSPLAHRAAIDPTIVRALDLPRHGLRIVKPDALVCAPTGRGAALTLWADPALAAREIATFSARDAGQYPPFLASVAAVSRVLRRLIEKPAPEPGGLSATDLLALLLDGRAFRALNKADAYRLLRWLPMPAADLAREWFESEPLCATVAASGVVGAFVGPRSPGSAAGLLWLAAGEGQPLAPGWAAIGGMGAIAEALASAARGHGAEIRVKAEVQQILVRDGTAAGVVLSSGEQIEARYVMSNADPRRTMALLDPVHLPPDYLGAVRKIRMRGTIASVSYAVSSLPAFSDLETWEPGRRARALSGAVRLCRDLDDIERAFDAAKYGRYSDDPWVQLTIPSLADPGLAPTGCHVVAAHVLFAPYHLRGTSWDAERDRLGDVVTRTIAKYAPGFERLIVARSVITPLDLERDHGLTGGQVFHGELALDQLFVARPLLGWARHQTPIRNLFLCGVGTHPGSGVDGRSGALAASELTRARSAARSR
jgi:phytoene dehydrogenase-like protein